MLKESLHKAKVAKNKFLAKYFYEDANINHELKSVLESVDYGYTSKSFTTPSKTSVRYLRITDIQDGNINWEKVPFCDTNDNAIEKFLIKEDDILFARSGNTVGKTIIIKNPPKSVFASYLIRLRCDKKQLLPEYLAWFFKSRFYWNQIDKGITGIGQPNFNGTKLSKVIIPLVSLEKQRLTLSGEPILKAEIDKRKTYYTESQALFE